MNVIHVRRLHGFDCLYMCLQADGGEEPARHQPRLQRHVQARLRAALRQSTQQTRPRQVQCTCTATST